MKPVTTPGEGTEPLRQGRGGFTLLELLFVTVILAVLALIAAAYFGTARERAMVAPAKAEVRTAIGAIGLHQAAHESWPTNLAELEEYQPSPEVVYCRFEYVPSSEPSQDYVLLAAHHRSSTTLVTTHYPVWGGEMTESPLADTVCQNGG
jgi:prepilin-type N-terminal cleavage/methylation domain-containing protein